MQIVTNAIALSKANGSTEQITQAELRRLELSTDAVMDTLIEACEVFQAANGGLEFRGHDANGDKWSVHLQVQTER